MNRIDAETMMKLTNNNTRETNNNIGFGVVPPKPPQTATNGNASVARNPSRNGTVKVIAKVKADVARSILVPSSSSSSVTSSAAHTGTSSAAAISAISSSASTEIFDNRSTMNNMLNSAVVALSNSNKETLNAPIHTKGSSKAVATTTTTTTIRVNPAIPKPTRTTTATTAGLEAISPTIVLKKSMSSSALSTATITSFSSEASTEVVDNRSMMMNSMINSITSSKQQQQQQQQQQEQQTEVTATAASSSNTISSKACIHDEDDTADDAIRNAQKRLTRPQSPKSPPKLTRRRPLDMTGRSSSTMAVVNSCSNDESDNNIDSDHSHTGQYQQQQYLDDNSIRSSPKISQTNRSPTNPSSPNTKTTPRPDDTVLSHYDNPSSPTDNGNMREQNLDFPLPESNSNLFIQASTTRLLGNDDFYEEEATPEQTAFGKELLFRRHLIDHSKNDSNRNDDDGSDILSTASEMGTIVGFDADNDDPSHGTSNNYNRDDAISAYRQQRMDDVDSMLGHETAVDDSGVVNKMQQQPQHRSLIDTNSNVAYQSELLNNIDSNIVKNDSYPALDDSPSFFDESNHAVDDNSVLYARYNDTHHTNLALPALFEDDDDGRVAAMERSDLQKSIRRTSGTVRVNITEGDDEKKLPENDHHDSILLDDPNRQRSGQNLPYRPYIDPRYSPKNYLPAHLDNRQQSLEQHVVNSDSSSTSSATDLKNTFRRLGSNATRNTANSTSSSVSTNSSKVISAPTTPRSSYYASSFFPTTSPRILSNLSRNGTIFGSMFTQSPKNKLEAINTRQHNNVNDRQQQQINDNDEKTTGTSTPARQQQPIEQTEQAEVDDNDDDVYSNSILHSLSLNCTNDPKVVKWNKSNELGTNPLQIMARSCFSFDAYEHTVDDRHELASVEDIDGYITSRLEQLSKEAAEQERAVVVENNNTKHTVLSSPLDPTTRNLSSDRPYSLSDSDGDRQGIVASSSWDAGFRQTYLSYQERRNQHKWKKADKKKSTSLHNNNAIPFRSAFPGIMQSSTFDSSSLSNGGALRSRRSYVDTMQQSKIRQVESIALDNVKEKSSEKLSPMSANEMEREDALDILSCLVERGISWKDDANNESIIATQSEKYTNAISDKTVVVDNSNRCNTPSTFDIVESIRELEKNSNATDDVSQDRDKNNTHTERQKKVLAQLLKSHEYALEMKRASISASNWLDSIGRSPLSARKKSTDNFDIVNSKNSSYSSNPKVTSDTPHVIGENMLADIDILTMKAMLRTARMELQEKNNVTDRLNAELAQCRAEIGRLNVLAASSNHQGDFQPHNRSILDASDDISVTEIDEEDEIDRSFENASPIADVDDSGFLNESFPTNNEEVLVDIDDDKTALRSNGANKISTSNILDGSVGKYQAALDEANDTIKRLFHELKQSRNNTLMEQAPTVKIPIEGSSIKEKSKTVDNESNYVSEWTDLSTQLQNPPSHGLRSPIVDGVLNEWTDKESLQGSLLQWMDTVLGGVSSESIPPLTINGLDHQVRDGFAFHIIPLLLRRPDILVDVKTRSHRSTKYDLSITIEPAVAPQRYHQSEQHSTQAIVSPRFIHQNRHRNLESTSASSDILLTNGSSTTQNSTATTALISNALSPKRVNSAFISPHPNGSDYKGVLSNTRTSTTRVSYDEMAEDIMSPVSDTHSTLMSTLGGALGGLLTRSTKKTPQMIPPSSSSILNVYESSPHNGGFNPTKMYPNVKTPTSPSSSTSSSGPDEHFDHEMPAQVDNSTTPFHRVVMAPSGRIGVTFVEYRGHCMVSEVAANSPLEGWIFPSDVLIAIDELAVSGMRVRDIIKILKERTERQRALRVISSHAMNDFALQTSTLHDTSRIDE